MALLADALEELTAESELKSEVVFFPGLEPFVEFDLRGKTNTSGDKRGRARVMGRGTMGGGAAGGNGTHDVGDDGGSGGPAFRSTPSPRSP
jgi:hypothetical protein